MESHLSDGEGGMAALRSLAGRSNELASSFGELERCCKVLETELLQKLRGRRSDLMKLEGTWQQLGPLLKRIRGTGCPVCEAQKAAREALGYLHEWIP